MATRFAPIPDSHKLVDLTFSRTDQRIEATVPRMRSVVLHCADMLVYSLGQLRSVSNNHEMVGTI